MDNYVIIDYTECEDAKYFSDRKIYICGEKEMFTWVKNAKNKHLKISIYKLGECMLDWLE